MIQLACQCGQRDSVPEIETGKKVVCGGCGQAAMLACGEPLPEGAGEGDFDAQLLVQAGPDLSVKQILLGGVAEITIGKLPTSQIQLVASHVSRNHAKLVRVDFGPSRWKLVDANSSNGTFVNGQRITEMELKAGDVIQIGEYKLGFAMEEQPVAAPVAVPVPVPEGPKCPSCGKVLKKNAKLCVDCGIDIKTGRSIAVSREFDEDDFAVRADTWIRLVSWVLPVGLFPVASEAMGMRRPVVTWTVFILTFVTSVAFFIALAGQDRPGASTLNLMLWSGTLEQADHAAVERDASRGLRELNSRLPQNARMSEKQIAEEAKSIADEESDGELAEVGFRWYQVFTCAFLHSGLMHFAGNMLFLIVFGLRVNELVGNLKFAIVYPVLAACSSLASLWFSASGPAHPMLGASGVIMGLAGMYFVFFPLQKVHVAAWFRLPIYVAVLRLTLIRYCFYCAYKVFQMRGFWLLALWIGFNDVLPMFMKSKDGVAHWAHVGGFLAGVVIALGLLVARLASAGGNDIVSVALGKRAWALIGKPSAHVATTSPMQPPAGAPRAVSMSYPQ